MALNVTLEPIAVGAVDVLAVASAGPAVKLGAVFPTVTEVVTV